jgi:hypothetical protein
LGYILTANELAKFRELDLLVRGHYPGNHDGVADGVGRTLLAF